jgi:hypothetical protein
MSSMMVMMIMMMVMMMRWHVRSLGVALVLLGWLFVAEDTGRPEPPLHRPIRVALIQSCGDLFCRYSL